MLAATRPSHRWRGSGAAGVPAGRKVGHRGHASPASRVTRGLHPALFLPRLILRRHYLVFDVASVFILCSFPVCDNGRWKGLWFPFTNGPVSGEDPGMLAPQTPDHGDGPKSLSAARASRRQSPVSGPRLCIGAPGANELDTVTSEPEL